MAEAITLHIEGMTCTSCAEHVQQALTNVPGVRAASVSYPQRQAEIVVAEILGDEQLAPPGVLQHPHRHGRGLDIVDHMVVGHSLMARKRQ